MGLTLTELRRRNPTLFYGSQTWFVREPFMSALPSEPLPVKPTRIVKVGQIPKDSKGLPTAVDLAHLYVESPEDPIWQNYLWCSDKDSSGQRVFVGGTANGNGLEIHRHLAITMAWGVPAR